MTFECDNCRGECTCGGLQRAAKAMQQRMAQQCALGKEPPARLRRYGVELTVPAGFKTPLRATHLRAPKAWNDNVCD